MARKRDHKAEWARRKARAQSLGYTSVQQAQKARKATGTRRNQPTPSLQQAIDSVPSFNVSNRTLNRLRRESRAWALKHSHSARSAYREDMSDDEVRAFHRAYVQRVTGMSRQRAAREKRKRIRDYVIEYHDVQEDEWTQKYELTPV